MNRATGDVASAALLEQILRELQSIGRKLDRAPAPPPDPLIVEIHAFIGGLWKFTASELIATADPALAEAIGERSAGELGRMLRTAEGCEIRGQRLTFEGRSVDGNVWCFR